jgi:hypothetical protein
MAGKDLTRLVDWTKARPEAGGASVAEVTVGLRLRRDGRIDLFANADAVARAEEIPDFLEEVARVLRENMRSGKARTS